MKKVAILSVADVLINISAGWFGLTIYYQSTNIEIVKLTVNIINGIFALLLAIILRNYESTRIS